MKSYAIVTVLLAVLSLGFVSCSSTGPKLMSKAEAQARVLRAQVRSTNGFHPAEADVAILQQAAHLPKDKHGMPTYSDQVTHRYVRTTAYSCAENEVGAIENYNAAGGRLKYGQVRSAAADWSKYPVGTKFKIKGLPYTYVVDDYGSALTGTNTIDIYHPTLKLMNKWASRPVEIDVIQWGSWERTLSLLKGRRGYWHCRDMYYAAKKKVESGEAVASYTNPASPQG